MNKKLLAQVALILLTGVIIFIFINIYNNKKNNLANNNVEREKNNFEINSKKDSGELIQGLEYLSKDINGNIYNIRAESGIVDEKNPDIINLTNVRAELKFDKDKVVKVSSNKAIYNNYNYDTIFINNVILDYKVHKIYCKKMVAKFSENIAVLSENLIYENLSTKLFADQIKVDLLSRNTEISMFNKKNKIKIIHKNNGTN
tara:strand:+ start:860 stop:1465 length:606 start_codon:yes stop_codon:yes gene_type:complete